MASHRYAWLGTDRHGHTQTGVLHAQSTHEVAAVLREQRIRATRIQRHWQMPTWLTLRRAPTLTARDVVQFTRQLATLLQAGVPLLQAFDILGRGQNPAARQALIEHLHAKVESGESLNQALREHRAFDALYCNLVAAGELAGMLDTMLERLAHHLEKAETLRITLRTALIYPSAVLGIASAVLTLILWFVVPAFQNVFAAFDAELPWLTRIVIAMSEGLQHYGLGLLLVITLIVLWLKRQVRLRPSWQRHVHRWVLRLPVAGPLTRHACTARWTRTLATLFAAGVPLTEALDAVQGVTGHVLFQSATQSIQSQLIQGCSLSQAIENTAGLFPSMVVQMCAIGEESGALDHMLTKTAEHYEREVDSTVARLSTLLEPFIMVVLGLLIGGLVMALYLPIFQLGQVV
jgi:type IV pilus assembly protein PilC